MAETTAKTETQKPEAQVPEQQTNCPACGKPVKKLKRYYRNGKFYCNKKCYRKASKPKTESKA
jgi:formylmethanofuran dehydrogenase subunit E